MSDTGKKTAAETKKKLFVKGGAPGPGRGHKKKKARKTFSEIEDMLFRDLESSDPKIRHAATKLLLQLRKESGKTGNEATLTPLMQEILGERIDRLLDDPDVEEAEDQD
jgi:hypothetical protein